MCRKAMKRNDDDNQTFDRASPRAENGAMRRRPNVSIIDPKDHERYSAIDRKYYNKK